MPRSLTPVRAGGGAQYTRALLFEVEMPFSPQIAFAIEGNQRWRHARQPQPTLHHQFQHPEMRSHVVDTAALVNQPAEGEALNNEP